MILWIAAKQLDCPPTSPPPATCHGESLPRLHGQWAKSQPNFFWWNSHNLIKELHWRRRWVVV